ncbi:MAG: hypothetical protein HY698_10870 [Deltaproteobacteria bacterium]|nr:hypothetical protein [Deltaproteobacteria bacterium]
MRSIPLGRFGKARLYVHERPDAAYNVIRVDERITSVQQSRMLALEVALEVYIPRGALVEYGLLGMRFVPEERQDLVVQVCVGEPCDRAYQESLARLVDDVRVGLPDEYATSVTSAICALAPTTLGPGLLLVDRAAHGLIGSSPALFEKLAQALVMMVSGLSEPDSQVARLFGF